MIRKYRRYFSEEEDIEKEESEALDKLKAGGGALAVVGGLGYGTSKGAQKLNEKIAEKIKNGTFIKYVNQPDGGIKLEKSLLSRIADKPLSKETIDRLKTGETIGKWMAGIGGTAYLGTKAYEHFKNKKKKEEDNKTEE